MPLLRSVTCGLLMGMSLWACCTDSAEKADAGTVAAEVPKTEAPQPWVKSFSREGWAKWTTFPDREIKGEFWCAGDPSVIKDGDLYRMFYTGVNPSRGGHCVVCQFVSKDAIHWEPATQEPPVKGLMVNGRDDKWDSANETCFIMKKGDEYYLYHCGYAKGGWQKRGNGGRMGLAISKDGVHFERYSDGPILEPTAEWYDTDSVFSPSIIKERDTYYMVYCGHSYYLPDRKPMACLLGATSKDVIHWEKHKTSVLEPMENIPWATDTVAEAELVKGPDGKFYLIFSGLVHKPSEKMAIGIAQADTPFGPWNINPEPIVVPSGREGAFDEDRIIAPCVLIDGDTVRMWYHGFAKSNFISMGYAEAKWPLRTK